MNGYGLSPHTARAYARDLADYARWCEVRGVTALPAQPKAIAAYLDALVHKGAALETIRRRLSALAAWHRDEDAGAPSKHPMVRRAWLVAVREDQRGRVRTLAASRSAIERLVRVLDADFEQLVVPTARQTLAYLRDRALVLIMFAGALTRAELETLYVENIESTAHGLRLRVNPSGEMLRGGMWDWVNPERFRSVELALEVDPNRCAATALRRWLRHAKITEGYAFRPIGDHGIGERFEPRRINEIVRDIGLRAEVPIQGLTTRALRRGRAAQLAHDGASDEEICTTTGLRSVTTVADVVSRARRLREDERAMPLFV